MLKHFAFFLFLATLVCKTAFAVDRQNELDGTWVIDARATEERVANSPRPPNSEKLAEWFGLASGYMVLFTYEFAGDTVVAGAYRASKTTEFQQISQHGSERKYRMKGAEGPELTVSMLSDKAVSIVHSGQPEMDYLVWRRGQLKTATTTPEEVMAAAEIWLKAVERIVNALRGPSSP